MKGPRGMIKASGVLAFAAVGTALGLSVGGCASSPPMRFYTLSTVESSGADASATGNVSPPIRVGRVTLPGEIDRPELVQRIDANRLRLAEQDRWAAPLGDMIRRTLSADLQASAGVSAAAAPAPASVSASSRPATEGFSQLDVDIQDFIANPNCSLTLRAAWTLTAPSARGFESIQIPPPPTCDISSIPDSMSRALAELTTRIRSAQPK